MPHFLLKADGGKLLKADGGGILLAEGPELSADTVVIRGSTDDEMVLIHGAASADHDVVEIETLNDGEFRIVPPVTDARTRRVIEGFTETERRNIENG
jgi:hypothetical protein